MLPKSFLLCALCVLCGCASGSLGNALRTMQPIGVQTEPQLQFRQEEQRDERLQRMLEQLAQPKDGKTHVSGSLSFPKTTQGAPGFAFMVYVKGTW